MSEGVATQVQNIAQAKPIGSEAKLNFSYTPLSKEQTQRLRGSYSRPLGGEIGAWAKSTGETAEAALAKSSRAERIANQQKNEIKTHEEWRKSFENYVQKTNNKFLLKLLNKEQSKDLTAEQASQAVQTIVSVCFDESYNAKLESFISKINEIYPNFDDFKKDFTDLSAFCGIFGQDAGIAVAHHIGKLKDPDQTKPTQALNQDEQALIKNLQTSYKGIEAVESKETGVSAKTENPTSDIEGDKLPSNAGKAIIGNRGKEKVAGDNRGQDRIYYKKLANDVELFSVNDGAGDQGHLVAEDLGPLVVKELEILSPENITPDVLKNTAKKIHTEIQGKYGSVSGSTLDAVVKLPDGNRYALHVGEGFIGNIKEGGQYGNLIEKLVEPQSFGNGGDGKPIRSKNGFKTPEIGVDSDINPVVIKLGDGPIVLASDGFGEILPYLSIPTQQIMELVKTDPQKAAEILCDIANTYVRENHGKEADDVSVMIIN